MTEAPDLWSSRLSPKWGEHVPCVRFDPVTNGDFWFVAGRKLLGVGSSAVTAAGGSANPPTLDEIDPAAFDPNSRLERLDEFGI